MIKYIVLVIIFLSCMSGCATKLTGGADVLNQRIAYINWTDKNCWNPDDPSSTRACQIKVKSGMRVRIDSIAIPAGNEKVKQQNLPSSYIYTVPNVEQAQADGLTIGRENAFFITSVLSMSEQVDNEPAVWSLMYGSDKDSYSNRVNDAPSTFATSILKPFLEEMSVDYQFKENPNTARNTSHLAKRAFCAAEGRDHRLATGLASRTLRVKIPSKGDSKRTIALGSDDWFYAREVGVIHPNRYSEFMKDPSSTIASARTNIELGIAIRFSTEEGVRYVSPCTTVADIEHSFGIEIVGIWREQSNLAVKGNEKDATANGLITFTPSWSDKSTVSPDGYYSIQLRSGATAAPGGTLVDGMELCGEKNPCLESVLLAHGDILLVGHRKHVLGSFWHQ